MSTASDKTQGLNILCIDGGGPRGLSSLILISEIMNRMQSLEDSSESPDLVDRFDVVAGTGTGGLGACMLGRLRMSLRQTVDAYGKLAKDVFSERKAIGIGGGSAYKGTKLREVLKTIIREVTGNEDERMMVNDGCKTMLFAMSKHNMNASIPTMFRSYKVSTNQGPGCTIWEALYATLAHPDLFKSIDIGEGPMRESFVGGDIGCINPIAHVLAEVKRLYPDRHVSCILSVGAGHLRTIHIPNSSPYQRLLSTEAVAVAKNLVTDGERIAEEMAARFQDTGIYHRFNVDQGMQNIGIDHWERLGEVAAHTRAYIDKVEIGRRIDQATQLITGRKGVLAASLIDGKIKAPSTQFTTTTKRCPAPTSVFTGREDQIQQIGTCISGGARERQVCVIHGLGGAGKTQIALKAIEINRDSWTHVLYVDASSREAIESTLQDFAKAGSIGTTYDDTLSWLESCDEPWLVVFDNADHPSLDLHNYFPGGNRGSILITTRLSDLSVHARGPSAVCHVSSMDLQDAFALLLKVARLQNQDISAEEMEAANALLQDFGCLVLAIVHAGAYIGHSPQMTISRYRKLFLAQRKRMLEQYGKMRVKIDSYRKTVYTTWKMCYDLLEQNGDSQRMLWLIAFLHHNGITEEMFRRAANAVEGELRLPPAELETIAREYIREYLQRFLDPEGQWDTVQFTDVIGELVSYSLVDFDRVNQAYNIHVLVQDWVRSVLPQPPDLALECTTTFLSLSASSKSCSGFDNFLLTLGLHVKEILSEDHSQLGVNHAVCFAEVYKAKGWWRQETALRVRVKEANKQALGVRHPDTLWSMVTLAFSYMSQGRLEEAEALFAQVVNTLKQKFGDEHPDTLAASTGLAATYWAQGRKRDAELLFEQLLPTHKRVNGPEDFCTIGTMGHLATIYANHGRLDEAESLQLQAIQIFKKTFGEEHSDTLKATSNLAAIYLGQGRVDEAELLLVQALDACKQNFGEQNPVSLDIMDDLTSVYQRQSRWADAEALQTQVLNRRKRVYGEDHPHTLEDMSALASIYHDQGRTDDAEQLGRQVLDVCNRVLGEEHPTTLKIMRGLIPMYMSQNRWNDVEGLHMEIVKVQKQVHGEEHTITLESMDGLTAIYCQLDRLDEAELVGLQVLGAYKRIHGEGDLRTLTAMEHVSYVYSKQDRLDEAASLQEQVVSGRRRLLGEEHEDTLNIILDLAYTFERQDRYEEAEPLRAHVFDVRKRTLGEEHPDTLESMQMLSNVYMYQFKAEAGLLDVQILETRRRVLGEYHPKTLESMRSLAMTYIYLHRWDEAAVLLKQLFEYPGEVTVDEEQDDEDTFLDEQTLGKGDPTTLKLMRILISLYLTQNRLDGAEALQAQIVKLQKQVLGEEHALTLRNMDSLTEIYCRQHRLDEAESLGLQVLGAYKRIYGEADRRTLKVMEDISHIYSRQDRLDEAALLQEEIWSGREPLLGEDHSDTLHIMSYLADTYEKQGRWKEAEPIWVQVVDASKRTLGEEHTDTLDSMQRLADLNRRTFKPEEAETLEVYILDVRKRVLGEDHPKTLKSMKALALTYTCLCRWDKARALIERLTEIPGQIIEDEKEDPDMFSAESLLEMVSFVRQVVAEHLPELSDDE